MLGLDELGLCQYLLDAIEKEGFAEPTPIQEKVIPLVLSSHDILAKAQTGSGKSASFVLPVLELLHRQKSEGKAKIKALVLTPTRELAIQVTDSFDTFGEFLPKRPKVVCVIGGEGIADQLLEIQQGCDIVVATTGRLLDIIDKKQINLSHLSFFIVDEADKMLDLGFALELDLILQELPKKRQNLLFSATYPPKVLEIASKITKNPVQVLLDEQEQGVESIIQRVIEVNHENRGPLLRHLLDTQKWEHVLVFMANKRSADNVAAKFRKYGFSADSFHGDLTQDERIYTLEQFKSRKLQILFATDIAARGLDINDLSCVVNFDLPRSSDDYTHRIGRTGRAGKTGIAVSFISHEDKEHFALIEKRSGICLEREQIAGYELTGTAPIRIHGNEPIKGKRKSKKDKARELAKDATKS
jgi:ATP-dependent RNA helicase RhlE